MGRGWISVRNSRELQATVLAIRYAPVAIRKAVRNENRGIIAPQWSRELRKQKATVQQSRVLVDTARVRVTDRGVTMTSGTAKRRALSGGGKPYDLAKGMEFGSNGDRVSTYTSRRRGSSFNVKRHTTRQMPRVRRTGYIVFPAFAEIAPRALALWVQTSVKIIADAFEGKRT